VKLYDVFCLGMAQDVNLGGFETRDPDSQLIDKIEESQVFEDILSVAACIIAIIT